MKSEEIVIGGVYCGRYGERFEVRDLRGGNVTFKVLKRGLYPGVKLTGVIDVLPMAAFLQWVVEGE